MKSPYLPPGGHPRPPWEQQPGGWQGYGQSPGSWHQQPRPPYAVAAGFTQQPPGFPPPHPTRHRKPSPLPWILLVGTLGAALAVVVLFLGLVSPGWFYRTEFDAAAVGKGVEQILTRSYRIEGVETATCPSAQPVRPSHTFDCQVTVAGQQRTVSVTVKDGQGTYQVSQPR